MCQEGFSSSQSTVSRFLYFCFEQPIGLTQLPKTVEKLLANFPFHALFNPESSCGWGTTLSKKFDELYLSELLCFLGLRQEQPLLHQVLLCWGNSWCFAVEMLGKAWLYAHIAVWKSEVSNWFLRKVKKITFPSKTTETTLFLPSFLFLFLFLFYVFFFNCSLISF